MNEEHLLQLEKEYLEAGGDLSLLEARLRMTSEERFLAHLGALQLVIELKKAGEALYARPQTAHPTPG
ncbi:MAG: hypothetical protein HY901_17985 [Deltaproteobacteria bacterium]|nr:hypothetical protein [Deltaproteobacteria bacterium]